MSYIVEASTKGFVKAAAYDAHRPSYPPKAVGSLLQHLQVTGLKGARILDLGAGTGKFTEILTKQEENFQIFAVEPHDAMRQELCNKELPGVKVLKGDAKAIPIDNQVFDAVVAAQVRSCYFHQSVV